MGLLTITRSSVAGLLEESRERRRHARLRRELNRLPRYIANDIGIEPGQEHLVNFPDR